MKNSSNLISVKDLEEIQGNISEINSNIFNTA